MIFSLYGPLPPDFAVFCYCILKPFFNEAINPKSSAGGFFLIAYDDD